LASVYLSRAPGRDNRAASERGLDWLFVSARRAATAVGQEVDENASSLGICCDQSLMRVILETPEPAASHVAVP
jgi:hypothetical protein